MGSRSDLVRPQRDLPASARRRGGPFTIVVRSDDGTEPRADGRPPAQTRPPDGAPSGVGGHQDESCAEPICADRAIFTSIRSPMGVGYRVTAASGGITAAERGEITQRSPSHGNLVDTSPDATGLAAYPLQSGRFCVAWSRHAGVEHTARGGQRIYTEAVVLGESDFERFGRDPLSVADAVRAVTGDALLLDARDRVDPLMLPPPGSRRATVPPRRAERVSAEDCGRAAFVLGAVLDRRRLVVGGSVAARPLLDRIYAAVPAALRADLSWSLGLRFSIARRLQLVFADSGRNELERMVEGQDIELVEWPDTPHECDTEFGDWVRLATDRWRHGRQDELDALSRRMTQHDAPAALNRIARLARDLDRVQDAHRGAVAAIAATHRIELYPTDRDSEATTDDAAGDAADAVSAPGDDDGDRHDGAATNDPVYDNLLAELRGRLLERIRQLDEDQRGNGSACGSGLI